jgi:hypothetical protein
METKEFYKYLKENWNWIDSDSHLSKTWINISWKTIPYKSISSLEWTYLDESFWKIMMIILSCIAIIIWITINSALWLFALLWLIISYLTRSKKVYIIKILNHAWVESYICSFNLKRFTDFRQDIERNIYN